MTTLRRAALGLAFAGAAWAASAQLPPPFKPVPATTASPAQRDAAAFFRSVHVEVGDVDAPLLSLNPVDPRHLPAILDSAGGRLWPLQQPAQPLAGVRILQPLALGPFSGRYAAAQARVLDGREQRDAWGYVDRQGRWVVAPRFSRAETPVQRWAKVSSEDSFKLAGRAILDLDRGGAAVDLPDGRKPRGDALVPLGPHAGFVLMESAATDDGGNFSPFLLNGISGGLLPLPGLPVAQRGAGGGMLILDDNRLFDIASGRIVPAPPAGYLPRQLVPGVVALQNSTDKGVDITLFKPSTQTRLVSGLRAVESLGDRLFVACDRGDNRWPIVRRGQQDPRPLLPEDPLRCGLMDADGRWRVASRFQQFMRLDDGVIVMRNADAWCTVDPRSAAEPRCGAQVPPAFLQSGLWLDGETSPPRSAAEAPQLRLGYRDAQGAPKIAFRFERATPFAGQLAAVQLHGVPGLIDPSGRWWTAPPASHVVSLVLDSDTHAPGTPCTACFGLIDRSGRWLWPPVFSAAQPGDAPGRFWLRGRGDSPWLEADAAGQVRRVVPPPAGNAALPADAAPAWLSNRIVAAAVNGRWGLMDEARRWLVPARYKALELISDSRALAQDETGWGLIDVQGRWRLRPQPTELRALNDGLVTTCTEARSPCATFTDDGQPVPAGVSLSAAGPFDAQGLAVAQDAGSGRWGHVDRSGRWAVKPVFSAAFAFDGDQALVQAPEPWPATEARQKPVGADAIVLDVQLWPGARLAAVRWAPGRHSEIAERARLGLADITPRIGLMDTQGRWLMPDPAAWPAAR